MNLIASAPGFGSPFGIFGYVESTQAGPHRSMQVTYNRDDPTGGTSAARDNPLNGAPRAKRPGRNKLEKPALAAYERSKASKAMADQQNLETARPDTADPAVALAKALGQWPPARPKTLPKTTLVHKASSVESLARDHGLEWRYAPLHHFLNEAAADRPAPSGPTNQRTTLPLIDVVR